MMIPGSLDGNGEWVEANSLARSIEEEMLGDELIDLEEETEEATETRRRTFIALSRAVINHLKGNLEITVSEGDLRSADETDARLPRSNRSFPVVAGEVMIQTGDLRPAGDQGTPIPLTTKTLSGKVG